MTRIKRHLRNWDKIFSHLTSDNGCGRKMNPHPLLMRMSTS